MRLHVELPLRRDSLGVIVSLLATLVAVGALGVSIVSLITAQRTATTARSLAYAPYLKVTSVVMDDSIPCDSIAVQRETVGTTLRCDGRWGLSVGLKNVGTASASVVWMFFSADTAAGYEAYDRLFASGRSDDKRLRLFGDVAGTGLTLFPGDTCAERGWVRFPVANGLDSTFVVNVLCIYENLEGTQYTTFAWATVVRGGRFDIVVRDRGRGGVVRGISSAVQALSYAQTPLGYAISKRRLKRILEQVQKK
jgi:hypothetical protein